MKGIIIAAAAVWLAAGGAQAATGDEALLRQTRAFLDAYAKGDRTVVLSAIDPAVVIYGSDVSEVFTGPDQLTGMMANDQKLWRGGAKIGDMTDVSVVQGGDLAAVAFHAPFSVMDSPPMTVRFNMVWRKSGQGWRLVQSANAVPTTGQSAEALLKGR